MSYLTKSYDLAYFTLLGSQECTQAPRRNYLNGVSNNRYQWIILISRNARAVVARLLTRAEFAHGSKLGRSKRKCHATHKSQPIGHCVSTLIGRITVAPFFASSRLVTTPPTHKREAELLRFLSSHCRHYTQLCSLQEVCVPIFRPR